MNSSSVASPPHTQPSDVVLHMHNSPRFGHSNNIALLASRNHDDQLDYFHGVLGFCIFLWSWFFLWMTILLVLKCCCGGVEQVGCAAGGTILDVQVLKQQGVRKAQRKRRILRSWRVQTTFFITSVVFLMTMVCWNKLGVLPLVNVILPSLQQINQNIQGLAHQGFQIAYSLQRASAPLIHNHQNLTALLDSHHHSENCPLVRQLPWPLYQRTIQVGLADLADFVNTTVSSASSGWTHVLTTTQTIETILHEAVQHVYVVRAWMVITGVLNLFLLAGVALTLHYVIHAPLSCFLAYLILPAFIVCTFVALVALGGLSALVTMNADFCAGGPAPGSAVGTMLNMMYSRGMQHNGFVYDTLIYYLNDCVTTSPFASTASTVQGMGTILETIDSWQKSVNKTTLATFSVACQRDISQTMTHLDALSLDLQSVQADLQSALGLAQCQNIYPILQDITNGPLCTTSVNALTWMWSTTLVMIVLAFIIVSCRAGLFNAIVRAPPKHGLLKYQQKEFDEYKKFMSQHYEDAEEWKFEPSPNKKKRGEDDGFDEELQPVETFDTEATTKPSDSPLSSDHGGIPPMVTVVECQEEEEVVSQLQDVPLRESFELNASMVHEIENLGKGLDRVVKDLEALEESMDRADEPPPEDDSPLFQTPLRTHMLLHQHNALNTSISSLGSLLSWRSNRVYPNDSMLLADDTELKPLTPPAKSAPMAPRKPRQSIPRTRHSGLVS